MAKTVSRRRNGMSRGWRRWVGPASNIISQAAQYARSNHRFRKATSATRTKHRGRISVTRKRTRGSFGSRGGSSGHSSRFSYGRGGRKFLKGIRRLLAPRYINSVSQTALSVSLSEQNAVVPFVMVNGNGDPAEADSRYLFSSEDLRWIYDNAILETQQSGSQGLSELTARIIMDKATTRYTLKNHTTIPIQVWLYDCVARRDDRENRDEERDASLDTDPITLWNTGLLQETVASPGYPNAGPGNLEFPGVTPFRSQRFCEWWHVRKVKKITIDAGAHHIHTVNWRGPRVFKRSLMQDLNLMRKTTYALLVVAKGGLVRDTSTPFRIGYGTAELDIITETSYKFQVAVSNRTSYQYFSNLPTAMTAQGTVTEDYNVTTVNDTVV